MYWRSVKYGLMMYGLLLLPVYFSCKKVSWYEAKPDSNLAVPTTLTDFQALMDNADLFTRTTPALGEAASDGHYVPDGTFLSPNSFNAYTWSHDQPYTSIDEWNQQGIHGAYAIVYYCNLVLEGLEKYKTQHQLTDSEWKQWRDIYGQALFYRAKAFFDIAQVFAPPYDSLTAAAEPGVPLRLSSDATIPSVRSTVQKTYQQVTNDLLAAIDSLPAANLPSTVLLKCRPTVPAVLALLARVYLSMEKYEQATQYATLAINRYGLLLDYNRISFNTTVIPAFNAEVLLQTAMSNQFEPVKTGSLRIDSNWYNLYDAHDLRKQFFFGKDGVNRITFKCSYGAAGILFSGLATDELYLIRAEGYARHNETRLALNDLDTLLKKRWDTTPYIPVSAASPEAALRLVLLERKKELLLRGLRWSDLRRLNRDELFKETLYHTVAGKQYELLPGSYKYTFPIPDDIVRLSTMPQNPGW